MSSFWGTGTMFYGHSDSSPRGESHVATEWITLMWFPIIPLGSYRIWPAGYGTEYSLFPPGISQTMSYEKVKVKFHGRQALKTFLIGGLPFWIMIVSAFISSLKKP